MTVSLQQKASFSCLSSFKGHVRRIDSVYWFLVIRSIRGRLNSWTFFTRLFLEIPTDRPTKVREKNVRLQESVWAQRRVLVNLGFWEAGFGLLFGATWFQLSGDLRFDQQRTITNFGDPSGQRHVGGRRRDTHTADKVLTHGQTLLFYRYRYAVLSYAFIKIGQN